MTMRSSRSSYSNVACPLALRNSLLPPVTANTTSSASIRPTPCASISAPSRSSEKVATTLHSRRASALGPGELVVVHTPSKRPSSVSSDSSYIGPEKVYTSPMEGPSSPRSSSCSSSSVTTTVKVSWPPAAVSSNVDNPTRAAIDPMKSALLGTVLPFPLLAVVCAQEGGNHDTRGGSMHPLQRAFGHGLYKGVLPVFTELPRRVILGNLYSADRIFMR